MKIALTSIFVNDVDAAFAFYTQVLGFAERMYMPQMRLAIVISPEQPQGTGLLLSPCDNELGRNFQQGLYAAGIPAMVMGTDDITHDYQKLIEKGVQFKAAPVKTQWGTQALFDDGCGNYIQLHQMG